MATTKTKSPSKDDKKTATKPASKSEPKAAKAKPNSDKAEPKTKTAKAETSLVKGLKKGDAVKWDSRNGEVEGKVEGVVTKPTKVKGFTTKASKDEPKLKVKSDKTGAVAIHKPEELKKSKATAKASEEKLDKPAKSKK